MAFARPRPGVLAVALISVWSLIATPPVWAQTCPNDGSFQYSVVGTGASTMGPFFSSLVFVYRDLSKTTCPSFSTSGSGFGRTSIIAKTVDFAGSNTIFTTTELAGKPKHWTLLSSSAAIVLCYNLPKVTAQLFVDRATVVDIYLRNIRFWNDTRLQALNPGVKLPGELINLVYRSDNSGTTNTFLQALSSFDPVRWKFPVVDRMKWPVQDKDPKNAFPAAGNYQGAFQVALNPFSIAYISLPFAGGLPYFAMINQAGKNVTATAAAVQAAVRHGVAAGSKNLTGIASFTSPTGNMAFAVDAPVPNAWPMAEFDFYLLPDLVHADCFKALEICQFLSWSIKSQPAILAMTSLNYVPLDESTIATVLDTITSLKCASGQLVYDTIFPHEVVTYSVAIALAIFTWACGVFAWWRRNHPSIARFGHWNLISVSVLAGLSYMTVFMYTGYPTNAVCQTKPWVSAVRFMVTSGFVIFKMFETQRPLTEEEQRKIDARPGAEFRRLLLKVQMYGGLAIICINFIIPTVQSIVSPIQLVNRKCTGIYYDEIRQVTVIYNLVLIVLFAIFALKQARKVLVAALFMPMQFVTSFDADIPDRSSLAILLGQPVGIIFSISISSGLVLASPLWDALTIPFEDALAKIEVRDMTNSFRERGETVILARPRGESAADMKEVIEMRESSLAQLRVRSLSVLRERKKSISAAAQRGELLRRMSNPFGLGAPGTDDAPSNDIKVFGQSDDDSETDVATAMGRRDRRLGNPIVAVDVPPTVVHAAGVSVEEVIDDGGVAEQSDAASTQRSSPRIDQENSPYYSSSIEMSDVVSSASVLVNDGSSSASWDSEERTSPSGSVDSREGDNNLPQTKK